MLWLQNVKIDHEKSRPANVLPEKKFGLILKQEGKRCPKRRVAQAAIRLTTAVIKFRNKERNVRSPS